MTPSVLIRRAEVGGSIVDVRVANGVITHVGTGASAADVVIDAEGGGLIPGLHDHHIHLLALAAARTSVPAGPPEVTDAGSFDAALCAADRRAPAGEWLRVVGYHESIAGELDRRRLDALVGDRPTRRATRHGIHVGVERGGARTDLASRRSSTPGSSATRAGGQQDGSSVSTPSCASGSDRPSPTSPRSGRSWPGTA